MLETESPDKPLLLAHPVKKPLQMRPSEFWEAVHHSHMRSEKIVILTARPPGGLTARAGGETCKCL